MDIQHVVATAKRVVSFLCEHNMRRALENLMGSTRKYADGGMVTVRTLTKHGNLMLTVYNSGPPDSQRAPTSDFEHLVEDRLPQTLLPVHCSALCKKRHAGKRRHRRSR